MDNVIEKHNGLLQRRSATKTDEDEGKATEVERKNNEVERNRSSEKYNAVNEI